MVMLQVRRLISSLPHTERYIFGNFQHARGSIGRGMEFQIGTHLLSVLPLNLKGTGPCDWAFSISNSVIPLLKCLQIGQHVVSEPFYLKNDLKFQMTHASNQS
jgi:hypothetical protein